MLTYREKQFNMFDHKEPDEILAHCISSDFVMGAGVARVFTEMGVRADLLTTRPQKWEGEGYCILSTIPDGNNKGQTVANLITKEKVWFKPTYRNIAEALIDLRNQLIAKGDTTNKIVIPYLGCGIDGKEWEKVEDVMLSIFSASYGKTEFDIELDYRAGEHKESFYSKVQGDGGALSSRATTDLETADKMVLDKADEYDKADPVKGQFTKAGSRWLTDNWTPKPDKEPHIRKAHTRNSDMDRD
jgi:hypothetical protein